MRPDEALEMLARYQALWPRAALPDETVAAWAFHLLRFDLIDALEAVSILGQTGVFPPSLAELLAFARDCRDTRLASIQPALPSPRPYPFVQFLAEHPEYRARVEALEGTWVGALFARLVADELARARAA